MGHLFLDAYHATGDEYYYQAAEAGGRRADLGPASVGRLELHRRLRRRRVAARLVRHRRQERLAARGVPALLGQRDVRRCRHRRGGEVPAAAVRREARSEIQAGARQGHRASSSTASIRSAPGRSASRCSRSSRITASPTTRRILRSTTMSPRENIDFLLKCYQALGDERLLDPITRGMNAFLVTQQAAAASRLGAAVHAGPQAGRRAHLRAGRAGDAHHGDATSSC